MAVSWGFALLLTAPSMSAIVYDSQKDFCVEDWAEWYPERGHVAFVFTVNCAIPIVSMSLLYSRIIYKLWCNHEQVTSSVQYARLKARKRVTVMLIIVTLVHTLCWSPNYVLYLLIFYAPGFFYGSTAYTTTVLLVLLNAAADPMLYTWYMDGFKRGMRSVLCCCHRNRVQVTVDTPSGGKIALTPVQLHFSVTLQQNNNDGMETSNFWIGWQHSELHRHPYQRTGGSLLGRAPLTPIRISPKPLFRTKHKCLNFRGMIVLHESGGS